jgi:hypothetical protein
MKLERLPIPQAGICSARCHPGLDLIDRGADPDRQQLLAAFGGGGRRIAAHAGRLQRERLRARARQIERPIG